VRARPAGGHPWLDLRDALTDLILEALRDPGAAAALDALGEHARAGGDAPLAGPGMARLAKAGLLDREGRLVPEGRRRLAYVGERCAAAARARAGLTGAQPPGLAELPPALRETAWLLRAGLYFEAHDRLESEWRRARGDLREVYQAVVQVAVALQHLATGNRPGAASLLATAAGRLEGRAPAVGGLDVEALRAGTRRAIEALAAGETDPARLAPRLVAAWSRR
jgi:predicted metal-dependent hydrolase